MFFCREDTRAESFTLFSVVSCWEFVNRPELSGLNFSLRISKTHP